MVVQDRSSSTRVPTNTFFHFLFSYGNKISFSVLFRFRFLKNVLSILRCWVARRRKWVARQNVRQNRTTGLDDILCKLVTHYCRSRSHFEPDFWDIPSEFVVGHYQTASGFRHRWPVKESASLYGASCPATSRGDAFLASTTRGLTQKVNLF